MGATPDDGSERRGRDLGAVLLFWLGYLAITLTVGAVTNLLIPSEVWQLTAWGFLSSALLILLSRWMSRQHPEDGRALHVDAPAASLRRFMLGVLLGAASYGLHVGVVTSFAGPIEFAWVPGVGVAAAALFFLRFLATSCMEEIGFRGYAMSRLLRTWGTGFALVVTSVAFGLSHLSYGWDLRTILLGVIPPGVLWGMSAVATRGLAVPIGLHAAWNFSAWSVGARSETGLLEMVVAEDALARTQQVATVSYLTIFGLLTLVFWVVHRRR